VIGAPSPAKRRVSASRWLALGMATRGGKFTIDADVTTKYPRQRRCNAVPAFGKNGGSLLHRERQQTMSYRIFCRPTGAPVYSVEGSVYGSRLGCLLNSGGGASSPSALGAR
jgi:hypothetical protein